MVYGVSLNHIVSRMLQYLGDSWDIGVNINELRKETSLV